MRCLVTGGAGFIGSHVAEQALSRGMEVVVLDDLSGGFAENVPAGCRFVKGSVTDLALLEKLFAAERFDFLFHLAAYAAEGLSHFIRRYNYETNLVGSVNLINLSVRHGVKCFVFTSSIAVYGTAQLPMTEAMTPQPEDPYGISKYAVELDLESAHRQFGLEYVIFRPHNVYGIRQNIGDKYRNVIGIFMNQILHGEPLTIFGDGTQTRAFSCIDDIAPLMVEAAGRREAYGQVFNVGGSASYTINELASVVREAMGSNVGIRHLRARNEVMHAASSHEKAEQFFGPLTETSLRDGIGKMASWARQKGPQEYRPFHQPIEIRQGMPEGW